MDLAVTEREKLGKGVRALRAQGLIPAELYGHDIKNAHLAVDAKEFQKVFRAAGESTVINLILGKEKRPAIVHDIARDSVSDAVSHVDFYQVRMNEALTARVPVEFVGEAPAVKEQGGFLRKTVSEIEVEALPADLPQSIRVDLSVLKEFDQSIYVRDLHVPKGVKIKISHDTAVATVAPPVVEEAAPAPVADVSTVKVESEEKKAERERENVEGAKE